MGIILLLKQYELDQAARWIVFIGLHGLLIFYFGFVHRLIFRKGKHSGGTATALSLLGVGAGQAYNRQWIKGLVYFGIFIALLLLGLKNHFDDEKIGMMVLGLYIVVIIDGIICTTSAQRKSLAKSRRKIINAKAKILTNYREKKHEFAVDTNILMHEPDLLVYLLEKQSMPLYMSMMVFNELDGLKKNDNPMTRNKAQLAFDVIEEFQRRKKLHILKTPKTEDIRKFGLSGSPDEKIIGTYLRELHNGKSKLMFLSNDKGARIIARNVGMPVVDL